VSLPLAMATFLVAALVWPLLRHRRQTGEWAVVFHRRTSTGAAQAFIGAGLGLALTAAVAWPVALGFVGPARLGVWARPAWVAALGWAGFACGLVLIVAAQRHMAASWRIGIDDRPTALVTDGPFAHVRNPIYTAMLLALGGAALVTPAWATVIGWPAAALLIGVQTRLEERHLLSQHGEAYRAWAARVGRFLPGIGRLGPHDRN
jgi:protein-S-isoprenylcysteine O-methyltransferase Ste14